jgi:uncharacterized membrane protein
MRSEGRSIRHVLVVLAGTIMIWAADRGALMLLRPSDPTVETISASPFVAFLLFGIVAAALSVVHHAKGARGLRWALAAAAGFALISVASRFPSWSLGTAATFGILRGAGAVAASLVVAWATRRWNAAAQGLPGSVL